MNMTSRKAIIKYCPILNLPMTAPYEMSTVAATKSAQIKPIIFKLKSSHSPSKIFSQKWIQTKEKWAEKTPINSVNAIDDH